MGKLGGFLALNGHSSYVHHEPLADLPGILGVVQEEEYLTVFRRLVVNLQHEEGRKMERSEGEREREEREIERKRERGEGGREGG